MKRGDAFGRQPQTLCDAPLQASLNSTIRFSSLSIFRPICPRLSLDSTYILTE